MSTLKVDVADGPVSVVLISSASSLAVRIRARLGGETVGVAAVDFADHRLRRVMDHIEPEIVILDGTQWPDGINTNVLLAILRSTASTVVVWGSSTRIGQALLSTFATAHEDCVPLKQEIDALLDLIRVRKSQRTKRPPAV